VSPPSRRALDVRAETGRVRLADRAPGERHRHRGLVRLELVALHDDPHSREDVGPGVEAASERADLDHRAVRVDGERALDVPAAAHRERVGVGRSVGVILRVRELRIGGRAVEAGRDLVTGIFIHRIAELQSV